MPLESQFLLGDSNIDIFNHETISTLSYKRYLNFPTYTFLLKISPKFSQTTLNIFSHFLVDSYNECLEYQTNFIFVRKRKPKINVQEFVCRFTFYGPPQLASLFAVQRWRGGAAVRKYIY